MNWILWIFPRWCFTALKYSNQALWPQTSLWMCIIAIAGRVGTRNLGDTCRLWHNHDVWTHATHRYLYLRDSNYKLNDYQNKQRSHHGLVVGSSLAWSSRAYLQFVQLPSDLNKRYWLLSSPRTEKCKDEGTWTCMEIEEKDGCDLDSEIWGRAKTNCRRTCNICSANKMTGKLKHKKLRFVGQAFLGNVSSRNWSLWFL
jgi:hypothetical protein